MAISHIRTRELDVISIPKFPTCVVGIKLVVPMLYRLHPL